MSSNYPYKSFFNSVYCGSFFLLVFSIIINNRSFGQKFDVDFGIQITDTITLPSPNNYILDIDLKVLPKKYSKKFYNTNFSKYIEKHKAVADKRVSVIKKIENKHLILIPPLEANMFYLLETRYVGKYNIFGLFREMHNEGLNYYKEDKKWMESIKILNMQTKFKLLYHPQIYELENFKEDLKKIDFAEIDTAMLSSIVISRFKILNFRKDSIKVDSLISFSKWINQTKSFNEGDGVRFITSFEKIPDYLRLYEFYEKRLKGALASNYFYDPKEFIEYVKEQVEKEKKEYSEKNLILPNFLNENILDYWITYSESNSVSTYTQSFETSYKRTLVPDFGFIFYLPTNDGLSGGSPYLGVNISLAPVNKNVPLRLSDLSVLQRTSIHTGVTLNSLKEENKREDLFDNFSLLIGVSYKLFTQSTRLSLGGVVFQKVDPVSADNSFAIAPYIGLSIDIEIKKWLEGIIPQIKSE